MVPSLPRSPRSLDRLLGALVWLVVVGFSLGPAAAHLGRRLLGADMVDSHGTAWFYWVVDDALARGQGLGQTDRIFWPWGKDLYLHTGSNILDALAAVPLRRLLGPTLGTNVFWLLILLATALAAVRLVRRVTADPLIVAVVAATLTFSAPVLFELGEGRPTQGLLLLPVLMVTALLDTARRPGWRCPVLAGLCLAGCGYQYWFYGVFGGIAALGHGLAATSTAPARQRGAILGRHALAAAVSLVLVAPAAWPLISQATSGGVPGLLDLSLWSWWQQPSFTTEGVGVALLSWQPLQGATGWLMAHPEGGTSFVPIVHLAPPLLMGLVVLGLATAGRQRARLLGLLLPSLLLALGPTLTVPLWTVPSGASGSGALPNVFFMGLLHLLPFARRLWWPARALSLAAIPAALALAFALLALRRHSRILGRLAALGLTAGWLSTVHADLLAPLPTWDPTPPAGHRCLAEGPPGAVLELPWGKSQRGLAWQSIHGRALVGGLAEGNASLVPDQTRALLRDDGWLRRLVFLSSDRKAPRPAPTRGHAQTASTTLSDLGVSYILLRRDEMPVDRRRDHALSRLLGPPIYQDARTWIYAPWGAPYPCPHLRLSPDTQPVAPPPPLRPEHGADDPAATRLHSLLPGRTEAH